MCSQDWLRSRDELVEFTDEEGKKKRIRARVALLVHHKTEGGGPCYVTIVDQRTVRYFQWGFLGGNCLAIRNFSSMCQLARLLRRLCPP